MLRLAGGLPHLDGGRIVVAVELDSAAIAARLRAHLHEVFGHHGEVTVATPTAGGGEYWVVRVDAGGESLARQVGLLDGQGRAVRGLPPQVVAGGLCDSEAVWRGAFLAHGCLTEAGRTGPALAITCPDPDPALPLALVGAARRLRITARTHEVRGTARVLVSERTAAIALLTRLGAPQAARAWQDRATHHEANAAAFRAARPQNLNDANRTRSARAGHTAAARATRALEILGAEVPAHLGTAARLRIEHPGAGLRQLGAMCDPALTKDAIAGQLRRLLALAEHRATAQGIPTNNLTPDTLGA